MVPSLPRCALLLFIGAAALAAQRNTGELRIEVTDPGGLPIPASGLLTNAAAQVRRAFTTDAEGRYTAQDLPFGVYSLHLARAGFASRSDTIEIRSEIPFMFRAALALAPVSTEIVISAAAELLDPNRTGAVYYVGAEALRDRAASSPGRSVLDLVNLQPGWLLEANGVLHPRGSEYGAQYVVDGIPITDNRSPAFAPELEADDLQSMRVITAGYPAEYGRKLGGVIEVVTERDSRPGFHGKAIASGGSFGAGNGFLEGQYGWPGTFLALSAEAARTRRYLDPPVEGNFTNSGSNAGATARFEEDFTANDRLRIYLHRRQTRFLVPNEAVQQAAGQRQDRDNAETMGQASYQRVLSARALFNVRAMARDFAAGLWSNDQSTPIAADQRRGFRETYLNAAVSERLGPNEFKAGAEASFNSLSESFGYRISDYILDGRRIFDPATPPVFRFAARAQNREQGWFVQDMIRAGSFTFSAGLRWDHYRLLVDESAFSPRLGAAWHSRALGLTLRASYDRIFQTPPTENLLLSSSSAARVLSGGAVFLPVRSTRGNQYEAGFSKAVFGRAAWSASLFRRNLSGFLDDSLLLDTGVSFPVSFRSARIGGLESKFEIPSAGPFSGFVSYSYLLGKARLPVAGGLFLQDDAAALLSSRGEIPITQDQRHTARARLRWQMANRLWTALGSSYGSGLPVEADNLDLTALDRIYGRRVLDRVNLDRGRVRPSFSLDASAGVEFWKTEKRSARLQADALNLTGRLNVINFAGLFSGTALAPPRNFSLRLRTDF